MDAVHRAHLDARVVLDSNAGLCDHVGHRLSSCGMSAGTPSQSGSSAARISSMRCRSCSGSSAMYRGLSPKRTSRSAIASPGRQCRPSLLSRLARVRSAPRLLVIGARLRIVGPGTGEDLPLAAYSTTSSSERASSARRAGSTSWSDRNASSSLPSGSAPAARASSSSAALHFVRSRVRSVGRVRRSSAGSFDAEPTLAVERGFEAIPECWATEILASMGEKPHLSGCLGTRALMFEGKPSRQESTVASPHDLDPATSAYAGEADRVNGAGPLGSP